MCNEKSVEREYEIEKVEDKVESNVENNGENADQKEDERSLDSSMWPECSFLQEIDFTAIKANDTPIHNFAYQFTDHIVEEEALVNLNGDEQHINLEPLDGKRNCIDLNADGGDHGVNLKPLSQEYSFDLNAEGGDSSVVKLEPLSQEICFDLNSDGGENLFGLVNEGEAFNPNCGSQSLQLSVSTPGIVIEDFCKAQSVDVTLVFTTDEVFHSKYALVDWYQSKARTIKTIVVTAKSDQGYGNKKPRLYLACERSGIYRNHRNEVTKVRKKRDSASRKCNCPFSLRGVNPGGDQWKVQVRCRFHNHELPNSLVGHPFARRLSKEEKKFVAELSIAGVKPKDVLCGLKRRHEDNVSTMKTIYNAKSKMRIHEMEGRTAMQQLLKVLVAKHYVYWVRSDETTDEVLDLFWAYPDCILLAKCFPSVVIVDCTYKTNKYKMPLFAMVGITSTAKTFSIAHCFLYKEVDDNYQWALSKLRILFEPHDIPKVFVTDREFVVINAIRRVFPDAQHMLCTFHIAKNVEQHCKPLFQNTSVWTKFFDDWQAVIKSTSEEEFFRKWGELRKDWLEFPKVVDYLARTWFKHREAFVLAWTNRIKHRGNRTTNRAEGSYGKLKKHLDNGIGTFATVFAGMDNMLGLQINEVKAVFERSLSSIKDLHHGMLFKEIRGRILHFALDVIKKERDRSIDIGLNPSACDHIVRTVYGLPCAHELLQYSRDHRPILYAAIDVHWSKLTILPNIEKEDEFFHMTEFVILKKLYDQLTEDEKKIILRKINNIATPSTTSLIEPTPIIPKGRPRGSKKKLSQKEKKHEVSTKRDPSGFEYAKTIQEQQLVASQLSEVSKRRKQVVKKKIEFDRSKWEFQAYMHFIPEFMHPFIQNIEDVKGDGHCGYRCIAEYMGWFDDKGWERVRIDLIADLERYKEKYEAASGSWYYPDCLRAFKVFESQCITEDHWMVMPDMGFLIASAYNCVLLLYSLQQCLMFFPHAEPLPQGSTFRVMVIAHVNKNHFVKIFLKDSAPIPHVATKWNILRNEQSASWMIPFADRITLFKELASCGIRRKDSTIMIN